MALCLKKKKPQLNNETFDKVSHSQVMVIGVVYDFFKITIGFLHFDCADDN